jgi:signal transduction histidine kinase
VSMHCDGRALVLEIRNDGIGGASMETAGSGLTWIHRFGEGLR